MNPRPIAVAGGGAWGTALAVHLGARGPVRLWCRREDRPEEIAGQRENRIFLPGVALPAAVEVTGDLRRALTGAEATVLAIPTQHLRAFLAAHRAAPWPNGVFVLVSKGIEVGTLALPSAVLVEELGVESGARGVVLSGPSFAREVAEGAPTAIVAAAADRAAAAAVQRLFSAGSLRVYTSPDPLGVQLAAALKNVVAIAAGVAVGLGFGANTTAALITRALAEISRLGVSLGARRETFMGLAGLGDLVLTCTGDLSRNRIVGRALGQGRRLPEILAGMTMVAEGVETCRAARMLAAAQGVETPIIEQVHQILFAGQAPRAALAELLARPLRAEPEETSR